MKTQYRKPQPRKTNRPDQKDRRLKFMKHDQQLLYMTMLEVIADDPALNL
jgi:hypothetical protein